MSRRTDPMETYPSNTKTNPIPPLRPTQGRGAANPTASVPQGQTGRTAAQRNTGVPQRGQNARQSYKPPTRGRPVQNTGSQPWLRNYGRRGKAPVHPEEREAAERPGQRGEIHSGMRIPAPPISRI